MELSYWQSRWQKGNIGWHTDQVYPHLKTYWPRLKLQQGDTVLVPLCGKSLDIKWLLDNGFYVIGVDISAVAIQGLLDFMGGTFTKSTKEGFSVFTSENIELWQGDFFKMEPRLLPDIDAVYDKAALIALPSERRKIYASVIKNIISSHAKMLLNCFEYRQQEMNGPPFAVFREELEELYGDIFSISLLHEESLFEQLQKFQHRGLSSFLNEKVYLLSPRNR